MEVFLCLLRRRDFEQLRIVFFLIEHWHEPIFEPQFAGTEHASTERVVLELTLTGEHCVTHTFAIGECVIKSLDEPTRSLNQHAMAHRYYRCHTNLKQLRSDRFRRLLCLRSLARFKEDE